MKNNSNHILADIEQQLQVHEAKQVFVVKYLSKIGQICTSSYLELKGGFGSVNDSITVCRNMKVRFQLFGLDKLTLGRTKGKGVDATPHKIYLEFFYGNFSSAPTVFTEAGGDGGRNNYFI